MTKYNFKTKEFGISDSGIHLLRSEFNYRTITFSEVSRIRIEKGKELHNWWLILVIGAVLMGFGVYLSISIIKIFIDGNFAPRDAKMIFVLLIPVLGGYFGYNSLQTGLVLRIEFSDGDKDMFPLRDIVKGKKIAEFETYLKGKIGTRIQFGR